MKSSAGTVTTGAVVSTTVIVNEAVPVLPLESVAVQVTVVGPKAKRLPDAGVQTGVIEPSTRSVAVAVNGTFTPDGPVTSNEKLAGTVTTGAVVSTTVIVNEAVPVLPLESVAVQVTVVGPKAKRLPDAGVQTGVIEPSTRSVAVAVNGTLDPDGPVASNEKLAGTVTTGAVVSTTVIVNEAVPVLPLESVAVQVTVVGPKAKRLPDAGGTDRCDRTID